MRAASLADCDQSWPALADCWRCGSLPGRTGCSGVGFFRPVDSGSSGQPPWPVARYQNDGFGLGKSVRLLASLWFRGEFCLFYPERQGRRGLEVFGFALSACWPATRATLWKPCSKKLSEWYKRFWTSVGLESWVLHRAGIGFTVSPTSLSRKQLWS